MGMVSEVFPTAELHSKVLEVATEITNKPLTAILAAKKVIKESENLSMRDGVDLERKVFYPLYDTPGMKEGVAAFIEKRKPNHYDLWGYKYIITTKVIKIKKKAQRMSSVWEASA